MQLQQHLSSVIVLQPFVSHAIPISVHRYKYLVEEHTCTWIWQLYLRAVTLYLEIHFISRLGCCTKGLLNINTQSSGWTSKLRFQAAEPPRGSLTGRLMYFGHNHMRLERNYSAAEHNVSVKICHDIFCNSKENQPKMNIYKECEMWHHGMIVNNLVL